MRAVTVLPSTAGHATAQNLFTVLKDQRLGYDVMTTDEFVDAPKAERSSMVVATVRCLDVQTIDLVRTLRRLGVPLFLVVEQLTEEDEVTLLHHGVYDVVPAIASLPLIGARLRTMYHHVHVGEPAVTPYRFTNVTVRPDQHEVMVDGHQLGLTRTEFRLLVLLARHPDRVLAKNTLALLLGPGSRRLTPHAVESHVSRLRTKITAAGGPRLIHPVRGVGYRLLREPGGSTTQSDSSSRPMQSHPRQG